MDNCIAPLKPQPADKMQIMRLLLLPTMLLALIGACYGSTCVSITGPSSLAHNQHRIQTALDKAPSVPGGGCVSIGEGDWYVAGVNVSSNTTLRILPGARLVSKINVTAYAVVGVFNAEHVTIEGGGGIHGSAEVPP